MKKKFILLMLLLMPSFVYATSGWLKSDSIVTCNGQTYGKHSDSNPHWHIATKENGRWYATGDEIYSNPCAGNSYSNNSSSNNSNYSNNNNSNSSGNDSKSNTYSSNQNNVQAQTVTTPVKSNDATLKSITIDNEEIKVTDNISYSTNKEKVDIKAVTNNENATVKVDNKSLSKGNNKIKITVTAEDGTKKEYTINIYRKDSNKKLVIKYDNETIKFNKNFESDTIFYNEDKITFDVKAKSKKTTTDVKDSYKLTVGDNKIVIIATAEDGTSRKYTINVQKEDTSSLSYKISTGIAYVIAIAILLSPIFLIVFIVKKIKKFKKSK